MKKHTKMNSSQSDQNNKKNTRRSFLKKSVYAAPTLFILGELAKPTKVHADSGEPMGNPIW
jgi:hypothetical protein